MKRTRGNAHILVPGEGSERETAIRLYAAKTPLYVQILDEVARHPGMRFNDLLVVVPKAGSKNLLTKALHRLQLEGVLTRRGMGERAGYELTPHGVAVRDAVVEHRAIDRQLGDQAPDRYAHAAPA